MRALGALLLIIATIGWAVVGWAGLFPYLEALDSFDYTLVDGIVGAVLYLIAPVMLAMAWSLVLQNRLPTRTQFRIAGIAIVALAALVSLAIPVAYAVGWLVDNTAL